MNYVTMGVDPDSDLFGVCLMINTEVELKSLDLFDLVKFISSFVDESPNIYIEDITSSYFIYEPKTFATWPAKKKEDYLVKRANSIGRCQQNAVLLSKQLTKLGIKHTLSKPIKGQKTVNSIVFEKLTGIKTKEKDQDLRDAYLIAYKYHKIKR